VDLRAMRPRVHAQEPARADGPSPRRQSPEQPPDGSNWELLCVYCHDNEHQKLLEAAQRGGGAPSSSSGPPPATHSPFASLKDLLEKKPK
jgi:hypothetical protein